MKFHISMISTHIQRAFAAMKQRTRTTLRFVERKPGYSFFGLLTLLLMLIIAGSLLRRPETTTEAPVRPKSVTTYHIGAAPRMEVSASVDKSGVITIYAQTAGIVSNLNVREGDHVTRGTTLVSLASNYTGANALSLQRRLSQIQHDQMKQTYDTQKDIISKQREAAELSHENAEELRAITNASLADTRDLISLNDTILQTLTANLDTLIATNVGGANDGDILQVQQIISQFQSANTGLRSQLRSTEYQASDSQPPKHLADVSRDIMLKQLALQEKALDVSLETSKIQLKLARISESLMFPATPCTGVVQRVHVQFGQSVTPGTPLVTISADTTSLTAMALVPQNVAGRISMVEQSTVWINGSQFELTPAFISTEATHGQLYSVLYALPEDAATLVTDNQFIRVSIPIGHADTTSAIPFIPIDSVFQTQDTSYVFVVQDGRAQSKQITPGLVHGNFVEVQDGLADDDTIIVSRNVIAGDTVEASN